MGTKNDPGTYDCYAKLEPDEPYFLLKSTDLVAPYLVRAWAYLRAGDLVGAVHMMGLASEALRVSNKALLSLDSPKSIEAQRCSEAMQDWKIRKQKPASL